MTEVATTPVGEGLVAALVFLHGSGDSGAGVRSWLERASGGAFEIRLQTAGISAVFPNAPVVPYKLCGGSPQAVWFDREEMSYEDPEDRVGVERSVALVDAEIDVLVASGVPVSRICVGGLSMGGALALHVAYGSGRHAGELAGAACLSGFLPVDSCLDTIAATRFATQGVRPPPLFMAHGGADIIVRLSWAKQTRTRLLAVGVPIPEDLQMYPQIGHDLCDWEVEDLADFVIGCVHQGSGQRGLGADDAKPS